MSSLREERGFTLVELLTAMTLMMIVLGATLSPLDSLWRNTSHNERQNEAQDQARNAIDRMTRELRNTAGTSQLIEKAGGNDVVFKTVEPLSSPSGSNSSNTQRVRYCLDSTTSSRLWRETQTWTTSLPPALPATTSCPAAGFSSDSVVASYIANGATPIFAYDTGVLTDIAQINTDLFIDVDTSQQPPATELKSGIVLRNQNKAPSASMTATATGNRHVALNATGSYDPEGGALTYRWCLQSGCAGGSDPIGTGSTFDYTAASTGSLTVYLQVTDAGGLVTETSRTVTVT